MARRLSIVLGTWLVLAGLAAPGLLAHPHPKQHKEFSTEELNPIVRGLRDEGYPAAVVERVFFHSTLRKVDTVVGLNTLTRETENLYRKFLSNYAITLARRFHRRHYGELSAMERRYGVTKEIVTAVLLVETQFGTARLPFRVLDVFTTLAVESSPQAIDRHYQRLKPKFPRLEREFLEARLEKKSKWAMEELGALVSLTMLFGNEMVELRGSYAGAFGIPQFLPSSYHRWAVDGDDDEQVDLDNLADAMASICNYLREHGWERSKGLGPKMRAVWEYNNSTDYVDTIFSIGHRLRLPSKKRLAKS